MAKGLIESGALTWTGESNTFFWPAADHQFKKGVL